MAGRITALLPTCHAVTREASKLDATPDDTVDAVRRKGRPVPPAGGVARVQARTAGGGCLVRRVRVAQDAHDAHRCRHDAASSSGSATDPKALSATQAREVERLSGQYQFFHWHLAFPEVFAKGGFDCVLGNPPWEQSQASG